MHRTMWFFVLACVHMLAAPGPAQEKKPEGKEENIDLKMVPRAVIIEFKRAYPKAIITGCSRETENGWSRYEIESRDGKITRDILYDPDGTPIVIEESIPRSALPPAVREAIKKGYPDGRMTRSERIVKDDVRQFEVVVKSGKETWELVFGEDGTIVKREKK